MFGLGKIKFIPGTIGSLATTIILYNLFHILNIFNKYNFNIFNNNICLLILCSFKSYKK